MLKSLYKFLSPKYQNIFLEYKVDFKPRFGHGQGDAHPELLKIMASEKSVYDKVLNGVLNYSDDLLEIKKQNEERNEDLPVWNNGFLPGLDIVVLYTLIRDLKPKKYIEIGSGHSTKVVRKALDDGNIDSSIISIDPYPRSNIDKLADKVIRKPVENISDLNDVCDLNKGDILFIDNSHRALPNSDVTVCFLELLPRLKPGVIVHVHDIYIPFDYPQFMCDRAYSEQYLLSAFFLANPAKYRPLMPNYYISENKELSSILKEFWSNEQVSGVEQHGGSFWFEVT